MLEDYGFSKVSPRDLLVTLQHCTSGPCSGCPFNDDKACPGSFPGESRITRYASIFLFENVVKNLENDDVRLALIQATKQAGGAKYFEDTVKSELLSIAVNTDSKPVQKLLRLSLLELYKMDAWIIEGES